MKKISLILLCACLTCTSLYAQKNDTYQIEKLEKPKTLLKMVSPDKLFDNLDNKEFVKLSLTDSLVEKGTRPVIGGFLQAYQEHRPITLSPDIVWLLICQGFSQHINNNAEELRHKFVNIQGQEEITVERNVPEGTSLQIFPWEGIFPDFTNEVGKVVGPNLIHTLTADFTTTTPASLIASQITVLDAVKGYFKYKVIMIGCGIPEVTIEGSVEDWEKIQNKLDQLATYDLAWWTKELKPIIQEIINTKSGKLNKKFWMEMIRFHEEGLYGSLENIDGWFLKFYPYLYNGERSNMKTLKNINDLPFEIVRVPFQFVIISRGNIPKKNLKMEFWAGFMGLKQNKKTYNLKPEIGWAINLISNDETSDE